MDCQSGSVRALEMLVRRYQKRLWGYAYRLTHDSEAAWDITQDSWLGIIKGLRRLDDPARFRSWAYRIVTYKTRDWMRSRSTAKLVRIEDIQDPHNREQQEGIGLKELLAKLEVRKRAVLSMHYFEQLSVPEISLALNVPEGTVKSRLYNARQELKQLWDQHFGETKRSKE